MKAGYNSRGGLVERDGLASGFELSVSVPDVDHSVCHRVLRRWVRDVRPQVLLDVGSDLCK